MTSAAIIMSISVLPILVLIKEVLEHPLQRLKCRSLLGCGLPATEHDLIQLVRTIGWLWHAVGAGHLLENLLVAHTRIGCTPVGNNFG